MSEDLNKTVTYMVVLGAGALGLFLAWDLSQGSTDPLLLLSRTPSEKPVNVRFEGKVHRLKANRVLGLGDAQGFVAALGAHSKILIQVYVCVPPHEVDSATHSFLTLFAKLNKVSQALQVVFLNNGLLEESVVNGFATLANSGAPIEVFRGLVSAGFMRHRTNDATTVEHNGGTVIHFGQWPRPEKQTHPATFQPVTRILNWRANPDIEAAEIGKFYTNLCLALCLGPQQLPNGALREQRFQQDLEHLAQAFERAFGDTSRVSVNMLLSSLWSTVDATARNINSVSLAGSQGVNTIMAGLLSQLEKFVQSKSAIQDRGYFSKLLTTARQQWAV